MTAAPKAPLGRLAPLLVALAAVAVYFRGLEGPFLFDDKTLFLNDGSLAPFSVRSRPVLWLTVAFNHALGGQETLGYHLLNVLIHATNGVLVLLLMRRVFQALPPDMRSTRSLAAALAVALLWTLHPLQTQAVAYMVQRAEALGALFALTCLLAFWRGSTSPRPGPWFLVAWIALGLGMATKEWVAMTPLVALCLDRVLLAPSWRAPWSGRGRFHLVSLALLPLFFWLFVAPQLFGSSTAGLTLRDFGPLEYLRTQPGVLLAYLGLVVWPHPLCLDRGWPITPTWNAALVPGAVIVALLLANLWALFQPRGAARVAGLAGAWFFLFLAPTSSFIPIKDPAVEHRMYLALLAPLALLVWGVERAARPALARVVLGGAILAAAALTVLRVEDYRSGVRMWQTVVAAAPQHARAWTGLGQELLDADRPGEAVPVLEHALELDPTSGHAALNLGSALMRSGRTHEAISPYRLAVRFLDSPKARRNLAYALLMQDDPSEAEQHYRGAISGGAEPDDHYWLAVALQRQDRPAEAVPEFEAFIRERPDEAYAHTNLAVCLSSLGRREEALEHFRRAVALTPEAVLSRLNVSRCLVGLGRRDEALGELEQAMKQWPDRVEPFLEASRLALTPPIDLEHARTWSAAALRLTGGQRPDVLEVVAEVRMSGGDAAGARSMLEKALELTPQDSGLAGRLRERLEGLR